MKAEKEIVRLSATDLGNNLACHHLTTLDLAVARGHRDAPEWNDPNTAVLQQRGMEHEAAYVEQLKAQGLGVVDFTNAEGSNEELFQQATQAIREGVDVIVQATLLRGRWWGRADVLRKVNKGSASGAWSYEVYDCKLARETRAATILQLVLYSEIVAAVQGESPEYMYVIRPGVDWQPDPFRVADYEAYYRFVKARLEEVVDIDAANVTTYPEPTPHCDICRWWNTCDRRRRQDDHLSFVADITKLQRKQLILWDTRTLEQLAAMPLPLRQRPDHGSPDSYHRVREQARLQHQGRTLAQLRHELLPTEPGQGLARLPEPSAGDIFLDLEGDRFVGQDGLEYLFGIVAFEQGQPAYHCRWAFDTTQERQAFEYVVDTLMERWQRFPDLHVYHFGVYEPSAFKRLMGRYATREDDIDRMLRSGLLVDVHRVLRQSLRASVESYSLKDMEAFCGFVRRVPLTDARHAIRLVEHQLELSRAVRIDDSVRYTIEGYNNDDCLSAFRLRDWLEAERTKLVQAGQLIQRPTPQEANAPENVGERQALVERLWQTLTQGIPNDPAQRTEDHAARVLMANLLDWHRREDKSTWWEFFRLRDLTETDLLEERSGLAGLEFIETVGGTLQCPVHRYRFATQDTDMRPGQEAYSGGMKVGTVEDIGLRDRTIDIKKMTESAPHHPRAIFGFQRIRSDELQDALLRLGQWVAQNGVDAGGPYRAARDMLLRRPPRLNGAAECALSTPEEDPIVAAKRLALQLDYSVLPVQGPPGSGKTYTGARIVTELVSKHLRIGVMAGSHKVVRHLLEKVIEAADEEGVPLPRCLEKVTKKSADPNSAIEETTNNVVVVRRLAERAVDVVAGTAWLWAREDMFDAVDVLIVDEASQVSLANALAAAQGAKSVVLLGDPQQLDQPQKGTHPDGAEASALEHLLGGAKTILPDRGLFLNVTRRLHPNICQFTSEIFYEGRLRSLPGLERQRIDGHEFVNGSGLWFAPLFHEGNQSSSVEEAEVVARLVRSLVEQKVHWTNAKGENARLRWSDILVVAPYNAQVYQIAERIPQAWVGTVDKFQGQQAPVVIYSVTTSSPEEAPRGMEFLYSLNRLNVATSRAQAACILVASPRILQPECATPRQMQLANALCRYLELSTVTHWAEKGT